MKIRLQKSRAFSLVEMLSVIAVIGIISAIAIPNIGNINQAASDAKNRRNAQNLASVCQSAQAAGLDFVTSEEPSDVVANIVTGGTISGGVFDGSFFGLPGLPESDRLGATEYLSVSGGVLNYLGTSSDASIENISSGPGNLNLGDPGGFNPGNPGGDPNPPPPPPPVPPG